MHSLMGSMEEENPKGLDRFRPIDRNAPSHIIHSSVMCSISIFVLYLQAMAGKMKLRAPAQSYQTQKVVLAAALAGVELETSYGESPEALAELVPHGKSLVLEVPDASGAQPPLLLARSNVALRFLAETAPAAGLYGETLYEAGVADQWLDFCFNSLEVPAAVLRLQGAAPEVRRAHARHD